MPPIGKPLKNDGPACRVCRCTENNPCPETIQRGVRNPTFQHVYCSWVIVEGATEPLCSACSGTEADAIEVLNRLQRFLKQHGEDGVAFAGTMVSEALARWKRRRRQNRG